MRSASSIRWIAGAIIAISASGCTNDKIVYRDRAPFNQPADSIGGFLGYYNVSTKQTTCGNCHADYQTRWVTTKHASAQSKLFASPGQEASCYGCHTVNGRGNKSFGVLAGHDKAKDSTYFDVQCESCHGPGLEHVEGVGQGHVVRPLAKISMKGTGNCGDCHSGAHTPFAEEWAQSKHAEIVSSAASNTASGCASCHDGRKVIASWGIDANYVERDSATSYQPTTCSVCHSPHGSPNTAQLRYSISSPDPALNLCMKCHARRTEPALTSSSPHAPQGAVLLGYAGYRPPGFAYDTARIYGSHATTQNPNLCAGCHIAKFTVLDKLTGAFSFQSTGHLMRPDPCLDPTTGKPTADKTCAYSTTARSWATCTASGCHASAAVALTAFNTVRDRMKFLTDQLWTNLNGDGNLQGTPTDGGLLATVKTTRPTEWSSTDLVITPAEGAEFNARLCGEYGQANSDNSKGIHNPFLCEALLIATINYVRTYYSLPVLAPGVQASIDQPLGGAFKGSMHVSRSKPMGN